MRITVLWSVLAASYLGFFSWYTSCAGPLTAEEIDHFAALMAESAGETDPESRAGFRRFLETDTGDDFVMVNIIEMREPPERVEGVGPDDTAADVMAEYMEYMWPALLRRASHPVLFGQAAAPAMDVWGIEGAERWSTAGMMRYRSRRDLLEIATDPAFGGRHDFKTAAMWKTVAFPVDPWVQLGDPRLVLALLLLVAGLSLQLLLGARKAKGGSP